MDIEKSLFDNLHDFFGFDNFKGDQEAIVTNVLNKQDTFVIMPTGGGKSICYQLPALMSEGTAVVISPLIALMKNQVDQMRAFGGRDSIAHFLNSSLNKSEATKVKRDVTEGKTKLLYVAPESLSKEDNAQFLRTIKVSFVAVDEAHCISEWGHDFRPEYRKIRQVINAIGEDIPVIALTATATPKVQADIRKNLQMNDATLFKSSFNRSNLYYEVRTKNNVLKEIVRFIRANAGKTGIIYCLSRKKVEELAEVLNINGIRALPYHAGLDAKVRADTQDKFLMEDVEVIVATIAFGMGIDKPDVRFVLHLDIPDSLEAYYQEAGRAGRDGKKAFPVLMYQQADRDRLWTNLEADFPPVEFIQRVYHHLGNHYQIAYGAGKGLGFDFDLVGFAKKYKLEVLPARSALKFLERDGWISLSEAVFVPSRFKFETSYEELYKFQVQSARYDPLIKLILRGYGGAFDYFVPVNEFDLAKKLRLSRDAVADMLRALAKQELAAYLPQTDAPQLEFLRARVDIKNLFIDAAFIRERRTVKEEQVKAMYRYLDEKECRSIVLQRYFGETATEPCGACDLCLMRQHRHGIEEKLRAEIRILLSEKPLGIKELIDGLSVGNDAVRLKVVRKLMDTEQILLRDGRYFLTLH